MSKRFYDRAAAVAAEGGHSVTLDGRPIRTPAKADLVVPTAALASAIAAEWEAQGERIDQHSMPHMQLACTAIDGIAANTEAVVDALLACRPSGPGMAAAVGLGGRALQDPL